MSAVGAVDTPTLNFVKIKDDDKVQDIINKKIPCDLCDRADWTSSRNDAHRFPCHIRNPDGHFLDLTIHWLCAKFFQHLEGTYQSIPIKAYIYKQSSGGYILAKNLNYNIELALQEFYKEDVEVTSKIAKIADNALRYFARDFREEQSREKEDLRNFVLSRREKDD